MHADGANGGRAIYVDLDDVLSETIEPLICLVEERFGRRVALETLREFDLGRAFGLVGSQLDELMRLAHEPECLAGFAPKPGAADTLGHWRASGYDVSIMTGRPPSTARSSREWLHRHDMAHTRLACVDKYGRDDFADASEPLVELEALVEFGFVLAVEDSAEMAMHLALHCEITVALIDRPWNRELGPLPRDAAQRIVRCGDWSEVAEHFATP